MPLPQFVVYKNGKASLDVRCLEEAVRLNTRIAVRQTFVDIPMKGWDETQKEERLLGVSATGWRDLFDILGWGTYSEEARNLRKDMRRWANEEATSYADILGIKRPLLVTALKPEGCWNPYAVRVLDEGVIKIDEINPLINTELGFFKVDNFHRDNLKVTQTYNNGYSDVVKITLKNGRTLICTPNHPLSINGEWRDAININPAEILDYSLGQYKKETSQKLHSVVNSNENIRQYNLPIEITEDLAWLIGNYFANGCFTTNDRIKLHCQHLEIHEKAQRIWKELFNVETTIIKSKDRNSYTQDFRSTLITQWLDKNGLKKQPKVYLSEIPLAIRSSSYKHILAFIAGLADGDGCFYSNSFCIDNKSELFIRHIQEVGEAVGLSLSCSENSKRKGRSEGSIWKAHMSRAFSNVESIELINQFSVKAKHRPLKRGSVSSINPYTVVKVQVQEELIPTYDIEIEKEPWYYQGGIKSHNTASQVFGVSSGLHWNWSPYYIRRVRMGTSNALTQTLLDQGFTAYPEIYDLNQLVNTANITKEEKVENREKPLMFFLKKLLGLKTLTFTSYVDKVEPTNPDIYWTKDLSIAQQLKEFSDLSKDRQMELLKQCNTVVFEFPVESPAKFNQGTVSVIEQLDNVKFFSTEYTDHMPSSTVTVKDDEWNLIPEWLNTNWNKGFITASFLPFYGDTYPLLPFQEIDEQTYSSMLNLIPDNCKEYVNNKIHFTVNQELLDKYEYKFGEIEDELDSSGECKGACPIR